MKQVGLYEAKTTLSSLVAEVESTGKAIALTKHGRVVAELTPPKAVGGPKAGMLKDPDFFMADDFDKEGLGFEDLLEGDEDLPPRLKRIAEDSPAYKSKTP